MSYGQFLALFLGIPLAAAVILCRRSLTRGLMLVLAGVSAIALLYTAPWDNLIVVNGVWSYGPHQILGVIIGHVPLEEYIFYVLQVFLTGILAAALLRRERG
jgi:lycopene cyclase domain-containing protein